MRRMHVSGSFGNVHRFHLNSYNETFSYNGKDSFEWQLVLPSVAPKEFIFTTAWVSDGSTSKYQTRHVSNTPTNS